MAELGKKEEKLVLRYPKTLTNNVLNIKYRLKKYAIVFI